MVDLWNEILPDDFIDRPRLSRIFYGKKYYAYPAQGVRGADATLASSLPPSA